MDLREEGILGGGFFHKGILALFRRLGIYNRDWALDYSRKGLN
jgi:hypothetical protein